MAPVAARAALESLLRERRLDTTLTTALPCEPRDQETLTPTGVGALDVQLLGGLPRGQLSEITGPRSSGRTSVLLRLLAEASRHGELVALIDPLDRFDPPSAEAAGLDMAQLLWVRGQDVPLSRTTLAPGWEPARPQPGRGRRTLIAQALDRGIKALNLVLQAGGFGLVALDLADVPVDVVKALPFTTWMRLQRVLEGSDTACVLVADDATARSAGGVSVRLSPRRPDRVPDRAPDAPRPRPVAADPTVSSAAASGKASSSEAFHAAVRASRHPFTSRSARTPVGRWVGPAPHPRRFRGLSSRAAVVRAERRAQTEAHVQLDFGD